MEQSSTNQSTCDVFMNELRIEDEMLLKPTKMGSLQTEGSRHPKMNENYLKKLHAHITFWRGNSINALCWAFYCVNDNKEVNVTTPQTIHCIICHSNPIFNVNPKTQARKGLITYNTTNGIATIQKHVNSNHPNFF
jgi:hypothetical protein